MDVNINDNTIQVTELIDKSQNIAIMPTNVGAADSFSAGAGLYTMLKEHGKTVSFVYPWKIPEGCEDYIREEDLVVDLAKRELEVAIDYTGTNASKVHYSTENDVLYLTVGPISKDFDPNRVRARIKGYGFDLIFVVGAQVIDDLGAVTSGLSEEIHNAKVINIDNTDKNQRFGYVNVVDPKSDSLSILALRKGIEWGLPLVTRAAKVFLTGISHRNPS